MHLGRPHRFYRAFNNLRLSPVSREVAGIALFYNFLGAYTVLTALPQWFTWLPASVYDSMISICGWGASVSGVAALYFMHSIYRIKARPFWNHWQVLTSFYGTMLSLGPLLIVLVYAGIAVAQGLDTTVLFSTLPWLIAAGIAIEGIGLWFHARYLNTTGGEAAASQHQQLTQFGHSYCLRNLLLGFGLLLLAGFILIQPAATSGFIYMGLIAAVIAVAALLGRGLFYALVVPTTLPGAFFWRNKGFEEHARETGLAAMPQVGVLSDIH